MINNLRYKLGHQVNKLLYPEVREAISFLNFMDKLNVKDYQAYQNKILSEQIKYVFENVPYYTNLFNEHGISPSMVQNKDDLKIIPILTKELVRNNAKELVSRQLKNYHIVKRRSGGTTGEPIEALIDKRCQAIETYSFLKGLEAMGYNPEWKMILLWGGSLGLEKKESLKSKLRNWALNSYLVPAFDINRKNAGEYLKKINKLGDSCIRGYASGIYNLACYKLQLGIDLHHIKLIITTSEQLEESWKNTIKQAFNCEVKSYYGCSEIESLGYQINENGTYLIPDEVNIIEQDSENNSLIISSLHNKVKPFLRYLNGDYGIIRANSIYDTRKDEIVELSGRTDDWLFKINGERISGRLGAKLISVADVSVKRFQLIQYNTSHIEFRYENFNKEITEEEKLRISKAIEYLFGKIKLTINQSDQFILSKNNKFRITICLCQ
jgi:phenylacetate-CoA ligase